jgi:hypothetical protein
MVKALNASIAKALGGDHCHSLDHLYRLPGTINLPNEAKVKKGRTTSLAKLVTFSGDRYGLDEFRYLHTNFASPQIAERCNFGDLRSVDLDGLPLQPWLKTLIKHGSLPDDPDRYASRSEALFAALVGLTRAGFSDQMILSVLLDPDNDISEKSLEKRDPFKWLVEQIEKVRRTIPRAAPYQVSQNGLLAVFVTKSGSPSSSLLTNFDARIVGEHIRDDGMTQTRHFVIEGELANGRKLDRRAITTH